MQDELEALRAEVADLRQTVESYQNIEVFYDAQLEELRYELDTIKRKNADTEGIQRDLELAIPRLGKQLFDFVQEAPSRQPFKVHYAPLAINKLDVQKIPNSFDTFQVVREVQVGAPLISGGSSHINAQTLLSPEAREEMVNYLVHEIAEQAARSQRGYISKAIETAFTSPPMYRPAYR